MRLTMRDKLRALTSRLSQKRHLIYHTYQILVVKNLCIVLRKFNSLWDQHLENVTILKHRIGSTTDVGLVVQLPRQIGMKARDFERQVVLLLCKAKVIESAISRRSS